MRRALILLIAAGSIVGCTGDDDAGDAPPASPSTGTSATTPSTIDESLDDEADDDTDEDTDEGAATASTSISSSTAATSVPPSSGVDPAEGGGTATGALADADVVVETDEGTIQIGVAEVPDGVSDTFPIPADLEVQLSSATETDFGFSGISAGSVDELAEFYVEELELAGYEITGRQEIAGTLAVYTFERDAEFGQVAISSAPGGGGSSVLVTIGDGTSRTEVSADG